MEKEYKKFASKMRDDLYRKLKLLSAAEGKSIQILLEDAVTQYLDSRGFSEEPHIAENRGRYTVSFDISKDNTKKSRK